MLIMNLETAGNSSVGTYGRGFACESVQREIEQKGLDGM